MEYKSSSIQTNTEVNIEKENSMERANTSGQMDLFFKVTSTQEWDMEMEFGSLKKIKEISILVPTLMIGKVVMADMYGLMAVYMKAISHKI